MRSPLLKLLSLLLVLATLLTPTLTAFADNSPKTEEKTTVNSRKTPIMGWASWNAYRTDISEETILSQAECLKKLGLADLGYIFVNVDDGW